MTRVEVRDHLGPREIEIDSPLYAIMIVGNVSNVIMAPGVYNSKEAAVKEADRKYYGVGYVVKITGTNA